MILHYEPLEKAYLIRGYPCPGTLVYDGTLTIVEREKGYWEIMGWMTPKNVIKDYHFDALGKIVDFLRETEPDFVSMVAVFDKKKFKAQERLWRRHYKLVRIRDVKKTFNGCLLDAVYVRFEPLEEVSHEKDIRDSYRPMPAGSGARSAVPGL